MKKVFLSFFLAAFTLSACTEKQMPDQGKDDQGQTETPGEDNGQTPGEEPGTDTPAVFEWPNDPAAFDYGIDQNESRRADYGSNQLPSNTTGAIPSAMTVDDITYGPGGTYYGNRVTVDQVKQHGADCWAEDYMNIVPVKNYHSFKINRPGTLTFYQACASKDGDVIRVPTYYLTLVTTVNGVTTARIVDEVIPTEVAEARPGNAYEKDSATGELKYKNYFVTLTVSKEDMEGITEAATVYLFHQNPSYNTLLVHYYPLTWTSNAETNASQRKPKFLLAGDSLVRYYKDTEAPQTGWGQCLANALGADVKINNHAVGGESTKSFYDSGKWEGLIQTVLRNDIVLIQFMHNDQKTDEAHATIAATTYKDYLKLFINETREKGGVPVLITSALRRQFDSNTGLPRRSLGDYPKAMREVAEETNTPLIDCEEWSYQWLSELGEEGSEPYYVVYKRGAENPDNTHFTKEGAELIAEKIAADIKALGIWTPQE